MSWSVSVQLSTQQTTIEIIPETQAVPVVQKFVIFVLAFFFLCVEVLG